MCHYKTLNHSQTPTELQIATVVGRCGPPGAAAVVQVEHGDRPVGEGLDGGDHFRDDHSARGHEQGRAHRHLSTANPLHDDAGHSETVPLGERVQERKAEDAQSLHTYWFLVLLKLKVRGLFQSLAESLESPIFSEANIKSLANLSNPN